MLRWPGNFVHFLWLLLVLIVVGLIYLFGRIGTLFMMNPRRTRALGKLRGWTLRFAMTSLGATFIKMGQVMSTRPDLFAPEVIAQLRHLQDRLPPFSFAKAKKVIETELKKPLSELYKDFEETPIAAASVAQVHRAHLADGTEVAVKVLRPGVRRQVERDAALMLGGAKLLTIRKKWRQNDPVGHTRHFVDAIHDQTDLRIEVANAERFRTNFKGNTDVTFPETYKELSGERVHTMAFVRGTKIDMLPPDHAVDRKKLAAAVRLTFFKMCFEDGFVHADLHPGNMVVTDAGKLVIFDLGLAKLLGEDVLIQFIDMSKCIAMGTPADLVAHLKRFHKYLGEVDWEKLSIEVTAFSEKFRKQDVAKLEYGELIGEMFAIGRKYDVHPVTDMMLVFVALITAQGIGKMLEPEHNVFGAVAQFLIPILMKRKEHVPDTIEARRAGQPASAV